MKFKAIHVLNKMMISQLNKKLGTKIYVEELESQ